MVSDAFLGDIGSVKAVAALCRRFEHDPKREKMAVIVALGKLRSKACVERLVLALDASSWVDLSQVIDALNKIGDPNSVDGLASQLKNPSANREAPGRG